VAMLKERRPNPGRTSTTEISRPPELPGWPLASRARHFAELEALIHAKERARVQILWDVPDADRRHRLLGLERSSRRRGQLAESARLAVVRRAAMERQLSREG